MRLICTVQLSCGLTAAKLQSWLIGLPVCWVVLPCVAGKLHTLSALLAGIVAEGCKVVVVSTSTSALDIVDNLVCAPNR